MQATTTKMTLEIQERHGVVQGIPLVHLLHPAFPIIENLKLHTILNATFPLTANIKLHLILNALSLTKHQFNFFPLNLKLHLSPSLVNPIFIFRKTISDDPSPSPSHLMEPPEPELISIFISVLLPMKTQSLSSHLNLYLLSPNFSIPISSTNPPKPYPNHNAIANARWSRRRDDHRRCSVWKEKRKRKRKLEEDEVV